MFIFGRSAAIETVGSGWSRCALVGRVERVGGDGESRLCVWGQSNVDRWKRFGLVWGDGRPISPDGIRWRVVRFGKINEQ